MGLIRDEAWLMLWKANMKYEENAESEKRRNVLRLNLVGVSMRDGFRGSMDGLVREGGWRWGVKAPLTS